MLKSEKISGLFWRRFVQRDDCYPAQLARGHSYTVIREKLTRRIVIEHLQGKKTIGLYGSPIGTTKWLCIDIDDLDEIAVREVQNHVRRFKIPYLTEFSGKKGYHLWVFFDKPYPNRIVRALAEAFAFNHEVFPKQNRIEKGKLGSLVKAPLGKHQLTGNWCLFLDKDLKPEKDQYGALARIRTVSPVKILKNDMPVKWKALVSRKTLRTKHNGTVISVKLPILKDCVHNAILGGSEEGSRNQIGHIIASELRRVGFKKNQCENLLINIWNVLNQPPLAIKELKSVVDSAYNDTLYDYNCGNQSFIRQALECPGIEACLYKKSKKIIGDDLNGTIPFKYRK